VSEGFWQRRVSRRRLLGGAASAAAIGGGTSLLLPWQRFQGRATSSASIPVAAEDIVHTPPQLAKGDLRALKWSSAQGSPVLKAAASVEGVFTSPVTKTAIFPTHVGIHWKGEGDVAALNFQIRSSPNGSDWSPWQQLWIDALPEENRYGEVFAALASVNRDRYLQYRAHFNPDTPSPAVLNKVTVTALAVSSPQEFTAAARRTSTPTPTKTPSATSTPSTSSEAWKLESPFDADQLLSREEWGAWENYRLDPYGAEVWRRMYVPTKKIVVHHTATLCNSNPQDPNYPYPIYTPDEAVLNVRAIYYYHAITRGWGDIGYNALIDRFGRVYEGRRGRDSGFSDGREIISPDVVAGHVYNVNEGSAGVSLLGNFDANAFGSTEEQNMIKALIDFLVWSCRRHYVSPTESSDFLMVNYGQVLRMPNIAGHCECGYTACPGRYAYARLPEWRQTVASRIGAEAEIPPLAQITEVPGSADIDAGRVSFAWKPHNASSALFSYYLEGWIPNLDTDEVYYISGFTSDKRPDWSSFSSDTSATFKLTQAGRYTFHVRAKDPDTGNEGAYETNYTFTSSVQPPTMNIIGVPGVTRN
jgi:hypothetical protein